MSSGGGPGRGVRVGVMRAEALADAMAEALTEREALVLRLRLGLGDERAHTLEEIGQMLGVTRQRVLQIEIEARKKLVAHLGAGKQEAGARSGSGT